MKPGRPTFNIRAPEGARGRPYLMYAVFVVFFFGAPKGARLRLSGAPEGAQGRPRYSVETCPDIGW